jgi:hypothetical protein
MHKLAILDEKKEDEFTKAQKFYIKDDLDTMPIGFRKDDFNFNGVCLDMTNSLEYQRQYLHLTSSIEIDKAIQIAEDLLHIDREIPHEAFNFSAKIETKTRVIGKDRGSADMEIFWCHSTKEI